MYILFTSEYFNLRCYFSYLQAFLSLVEKAVTGERNVLQASIINVSSAMSSNTIAPTIPFFAFDYQCSKAALNMLTVCFATKLAKSTVAPLTVEEAAKIIVDCINAMKDEHYGKLVDATTESPYEILPF
jgi:NAD(P)-dependent dehydrogenase (short-subunit alcohol dehydrogenase family)